MRVVYKYPLMDNVVTMPEGAKIISFARNGRPPHMPCLWAEVEPANPPVQRTFTVVGTGDPIPDGAKHIGTLHEDCMVWHLYEVTP